MASTVPSIKIVKQFPYRGNTVRFSNRYHFDGGTPGTLGSWQSLAGSIESAEKSCYSNRVQFVEAVCYQAGTEVPLHTVSLSALGTMDTATSTVMPGDAAVVIRWSTDQRSSKNHPIFLYSYLHDAHAQGRPAPDPDALSTNQHDQCSQYGDLWVAGFDSLDGTHHRAGPRGAVGLGSIVLAHVRHRDFPD